MDHGPQTRPSLVVRLGDRQDHAAWQEFVEVYEPLVYRLIRRGGLQDADAQEVTQQVLVAVAGAVDRWQVDPAKGSFRGWLATIARNLLTNYLVRQRRHARGTGGTDFQRLLAEHAAPAGPESALVALEYRRSLFRWAAERVRGQVQRATWEAFWQTAVAGRPVADVAAELGSSPGAVYVARSRVIRRLRQEVEAFEKQ